MTGFRKLLYSSWEQLCLPGLVLLSGRLRFNEIEQEQLDSFGTVCDKQGDSFC